MLKKRFEAGILICNKIMLRDFDTRYFSKYILYDSKLNDSYNIYPAECLFFYKQSTNIYEAMNLACEYPLNRSV